MKNRSCLVFLKLFNNSSVLTIWHLLLLIQKIIGQHCTVNQKSSRLEIDFCPPLPKRRIIWL